MSHLFFHENVLQSVEHGLEAGGLPHGGGVHQESHLYVILGRESLECLMMKQEYSHRKRWSGRSRGRQ